jgi:hypothetical protein
MIPYGIRVSKGTGIATVVLEAANCISIRDLKSTTRSTNKVGCCTPTVCCREAEQLS